MSKETFTLKTEGFKELHDVLLQMGEEFGYKKTARTVLIPAIKAAMQSVVNKAKLNAPYNEKNTKDYHLRDTIKLFARVPNERDLRSIYIDKNDAAVGIVASRTDKRAVSQEFGNAVTPANPWLRSALESEAAHVISTLGTFLAFKLEKYKSKKV